ncbi:MAG: hypothetical protein QOI67_1760 [Gaiellaceae bacterium]|jgi:hypothetical protein|nr:hypothetical protein [Gaiellaceae bacterium]
MNTKLEQLDEVRIVAPTGCLGYGFSKEDFLRALREHRPHVIAVDAGSTDPGPYYLGAGESFAQRVEIRSELEIVIQAALNNDIPLIVGTCGGAGARAHVEWTREIVMELAQEHSWTFRLGVIHSELDAEYLTDKLEGGDIVSFESGEELDAETIADSTCVVAQMGAEPIIEALRQGAQVILAGRACDDAVFAAFPLLHGLDPGLAHHMGKVLECGALASVPLSMDVMLGTIRRDHFELVPGAEHRACTVTSISSHSLYERENPLRQAGPGGVVDLGESIVTQLDPRSVRVEGTRYEPTDEYLLKLEGVRRVGTRVISIAGIRDQAMIEQLDEVLAETKRRAEGYFAGIGVDSDAYTIVFHAYGRDGVMRELEPETRTAHEIGLVIDVVADDPALAKALCQRLSGLLLHLDFPGQFNTAGNLAMLFSPANIEVGPVYAFSVYHLLRVSDPLEPFEIEVTDVQPKQALAAAGQGA